MNRLLRELAPITPGGWAEIETEAKRTLKTLLGARQLVDFTGPKGWHKSSVSLGHVERIASPPGTEVEGRLRQVQPLVELKIPFSLPRAELDDLSRGAKDVNMDPVIDAARRIALAEDRIVFEGYPQAGIQGICTAASAASLPLTNDYEAYPVVVANALSKLRLAGVNGPYAIALGNRCFTGLTETTRGGYPVIEHVRHLIDGPIVWAPAVDGAVVLSMRGDDFELVIGEDLSIGYLSHDEKQVTLYLEESLTFRLLSEQAAIPLRYASKTAESASKAK